MEEQTSSQNNIFLSVEVLSLPYTLPEHTLFTEKRQWKFSLKVITERLLLLSQLEFILSSAVHAYKWTCSRPKELIHLRTRFINHFSKHREKLIIV